MSSLRRTSYQFESSAPANQYEWQSTSTLERSKFVRLRKGYASVRKSFRLGEKSYLQEPVGFMNQLGTRLFRTMKQGVRGKTSNTEDDAPVEGLFRVLSAPSSGDSSRVSSHRKSEAELDIEQRLKRSKRRTLPSTRCHKTPPAGESEAIYEDLNLDELESIKRDNLRLTLCSTTGASSTSRRRGNVEPMCSCKSLEPGSGVPDSFCCCNSATSGSCSTPVSPVRQGGATTTSDIEGSKEAVSATQLVGEIDSPDTAQEFKSFEGQQQVAGVYGKLGGAKGARSNLSTQEYESASPSTNNHNHRHSISKTEFNLIKCDEQAQQQTPPEVGHKFDRHKQLRAGSSMRAAKSEWMLSGAGGMGDFMMGDECRRLAREELYLSSSHENQRQTQVRYWTRRLSGIDDYSEQADDLFERQLCAATLQNDGHKSCSHKRLTVKRSLLTKIKQFIVPSSAGKETINHISPVGKCIASQNGRLFAHSTLNLAPEGTSQHHYLTTGRKSINLANYECSSSKNHLKQLGFLTLGRQQQPTKCFSRPQVNNIFQNHQPNHHQYGSIDSLPSADSGLSCSNLQNLSEEQHYSRIYSSIEQPKKQKEKQENFQIVGRAIAKVDCNPCAYDKEALVFKRGDLIEIIERNQSGTWVGRCHGQVGHFKFINVTEMQEEEGEDEEKEESREGKGNGTFVTKLEIRNDSIERLGQHQQQSPQQNSCSPNPMANYATKQVNQKQAAPAAGGIEHQRKVNSTGSSRLEPASANTLEQLLFAIGLSNEQVTIQQQQQVSTSSSVKCHFYLELLNRAGLNSLESFSNIDDCSELEQIGVYNHEHQQRLLMAARIIRRASEAAKLDFIQNYQTSSATSQQYDQSTTRLSQSQADNIRPTKRRVTTTEASNEYQKRLNTTNLNEPIYVNLINGRVEESMTINNSRVHDLDDRQPQDQIYQSHQAFERDLQCKLYQLTGVKSDQTPLRTFSDASRGEAQLFMDENGNNNYRLHYSGADCNQFEQQLASSNDYNNNKRQSPQQVSVSEQLDSTAKENVELGKMACFNPLPSRRSKCSSSMTPLSSSNLPGGRSSLQQQFGSNRSQFNPPTSAYDLRLDLSHFFS